MRSDMTPACATACRERQVRWSMQTIDLPLALAIIIIAGTLLWSLAPGAGAVSQSGDVSLSVSTDRSIAVVPSFTRPGSSASIRLDDLTMPGQRRDASSAGWTLSSNWVLGYTVKIRSATDPAMRGANAIDGKGANDSMKDFYVTGQQCPCSWTTNGVTKAVFGYSAAVDGPSVGATASKWGTGNSTSTTRKWRGFRTDDYTLFSTSGGSGSTSVSIMLRSELPEAASQLNGSYRARIELSVRPNLV